MFTSLALREMAHSSECMADKVGRVTIGRESARFLFGLLSGKVVKFYCEKGEGFALCVFIGPLEYLVYFKHNNNLF